MVAAVAPPATSAAPFVPATGAEDYSSDDTMLHGNTGASPLSCPLSASPQLIAEEVMATTEKLKSLLAAALARDHNEPPSAAADSPPAAVGEVSIQHYYIPPLWVTATHCFRCVWSVLQHT